MFKNPSISRCNIWLKHSAESAPIKEWQLQFPKTSTGMDHATFETYVIVKSEEDLISFMLSFSPIVNKIDYIDKQGDKIKTKRFNQT